jgi:hypothetical protein
MINKRYLITYPNNMQQVKMCIDHNIYLSVKEIEDDNEYRKAYKSLCKEEWFTNKSAFAYAILNNGSFECYSGPKIIKIKEI